MQVSHHPPITNFYVSNRHAGFCLQGRILAKSKFYGRSDVSRTANPLAGLGNSLSAILDGTARLTLLDRGEDYVMTMPYANCKGKSLLDALG